MFRRPQPENFANYQLQASLGRQPNPTGGRIPIKRRKKTKIKKEKRNDSFLLRQQDVDKRRAVYRPDRLLELHQTALTNATRTAQEMGRGLTATGTTLGIERQQIKDADVEKAKGRVLLALANRLESKEPLINVGVGYTQHRLPEDLNSIRLPDREQTIKELGYREPREQPAPQGAQVRELGYKEPRTQPHTSHRQPSDDNSNLLEPLLQSFEVEEPVVEDITDQTPIPRVEKPSVGKLDPTRGLQLEEQIIKDKDKNADVEALRQKAKEQREKARERQTQTNEPQLRPPAPEPTPQVPEPPRGQPSSIYEQWKQAGPLSEGTGEFAPPEVEKPSLSVSKPPVREKEKAPPNEQQQRQIDAVEESKRRRQEKLKEKFGKLKEDILPPEDAEEGESRGAVEDVADAESPEAEWFDNLPDRNNGFLSGIKTNQLTGSTYSFVDTDGIYSGGKFKGKELAIIGVDKRPKGNVLLQLKDTIGKGEADASIRVNRSYKLFRETDLQKLNLKPLNL